MLLERPPSLEGALAKLHRANENILNLDMEMNAFLEKPPYCRVFRDSEPQALAKAIADQTKRKMPVRFSILIGEFLHNIKSSLNHTVCELGRLNGQGDCSKSEFPVFVEDPDKSTFYSRKVSNLSESAQAIVKRLQPYHALPKSPQDDPLWILHSLNNQDKHQELVLVTTTTNTLEIYTARGTRSVPDGMTIFYHTAELPATAVVAKGAVKMGSQTIFLIAFDNIGTQGRQPVITTLNNILKRAEYAFSQLAREFLREQRLKPK